MLIGLVVSFIHLFQTDEKNTIVFRISFKKFLSIYKSIITILYFVVSLSTADVARNAGLAGTDEVLEDYQVY